MTCRCGMVAMETIRAQCEAVVLEELQKLDQLVRVNCVVNYISKSTYTCDSVVKSNLVKALPLLQENA